MLTAVKTIALVPVLEDLKIRADRVRTVGDSPTSSHSDPRHALAGVPARVATDRVGQELLEFAARESSEDGAVLVFLEGARTPAEIAALRNALWPFAHVVALYRLSNNGVERHTLAGAEELRFGSGLGGWLLVAKRRAVVFAPEATVEKFDKNASAWNGEPHKPGYAHFRWMRRFVGTFAPCTGVKRILDFGCGAGWVGIEAALQAGASSAALCAFDPSAEMVKLAEENARRAGVVQFAGRTGFGEDPPFPAQGEAPFDRVLSSGVISFAFDRERWLDGLVKTLAPNATLVIGDIHRDSRGMQKRRKEKPLLPVREMNAATREEVRASLERRGLVFEAWSGYQLTWPMPQAMHFSDVRLKGALGAPLLWINRAATRFGASRPDRFDSWVMRMKRAT